MTPEKRKRFDDLKAKGNMGLLGMWGEDSEFLFNLIERQDKRWEKLKEILNATTADKSVLVTFASVSIRQMMVELEKEGE